MSACIVVAAAACVPTGEVRVDELEPPPAAEHLPAALDARPLLPLPRPDTPQGCSWLDPVAQGPREHDGIVFEAVAFSLRDDRFATAPLQWVQRARVAQATAGGLDLYVANAGGRLTWCYFEGDDRNDLAACEGDDEMGWVVVSATQDRAVAKARILAVLDHASRVFSHRSEVERCTPASAAVVAGVEGPRWITRKGKPWLEFVEQVNPRPDLARLVHVRTNLDKAVRTELMSWNPTEAR